MLWYILLALNGGIGIGICIGFFLLLWFDAVAIRKGRDPEPSVSVEADR